MTNQAKRGARIVVICILTLTCMVPNGSFGSVSVRAGDCHVVAGQVCPPSVTVSNTTFYYHYNDNDQTFYAVPTGGGSQPGQSLDYVFQVNCSGDAPPDDNGQFDGGLLCIGTVQICGDGKVQFQVWARAAGTHDPWRKLGVECIGGPPVITLPHLIVDLFPQMKTDIDNADVANSPIQISPPALALVNFPVIAATRLAPTALHITDPLEADVQITPVPTWDFGDHTPTVTGPVGAAYDGTSALDDPGHYPLTHTYKQPGTYTVTLTVVWTAVSVTTAEHPAPIPLPDPHPTATTITTVVVTAHEAHAVLVSGG